MSRSLAREMAMKIEFSRLLGGKGRPEDLLYTDETEVLSQTDTEFVKRLTDGICINEDEINKIIEKYAIGWSLQRISKVDLAILHLAVFEILHCDDIPVGASINEAVELAKKFGGDHSYSFINGILGSFAKEFKK